MSSMLSETELADGILLINKPLGARSTACVGMIKRLLGKKNKIGHAGTLDSTASGLLVILTGKGTRLSQYVMGLPKKYRGTIQLGVTTSTDDASGEVLKKSSMSLISEEQVKSTLISFIGTRLQLPPEISAIKVGGKRAHKIAREEGTVKLKSRPVFIKKITLIDFDMVNQRADVLVECHKGTYIRSLARELGVKLGCGAYLCDLKRISIGPYSLSKALSVDLDTPPSFEDVITSLVPMDSLCEGYTTYEVNREEEQKLRNGISIPLDTARCVNRGVIPAINAVMVKGEKLLSISSLVVKDGVPVIKPGTNIKYEEIG